MIELETNDNPKLEQIETYVNNHPHIQQYWRSANVIAKDRMKLNDHGEKHIEIVANRGLSLLRLLKEDLTPGIMEDYDHSYEDAEVVLATAALLHDTGHIIHRYKHSEYSLPIAADLIEELLGDMYDKQELVIFKSEILHAIQSHHKKANPLTLEASILRVADSLDIEKGRARHDKDLSNQSIHSISAMSIENVDIVRGDAKPVTISIEMSNSSGIFQMDQLMRKKIEGTGLEDHIHVRAEIDGEEKKIVDEYEL
ncbi:MAG: HD domain-containing protein [Candidatus Nanohaloarchaeota archaeon QJJ-5]|nr:HD domain-containing protein [Candidatus Nanohaloarchaeota archaeon QJJ-5]